MLKRGFQFAPGYRLQEFLGRGQFGQVWRATAPGGAAAAVKFIDLSDGQGQKEYEGVKRVKQIRHPNLMPITAIWLLDAQGNVLEDVAEDTIATFDFGSDGVTGGETPADVQTPAGRNSQTASGTIAEASWLAVSMLLGGKSLQSRLRECVEEGSAGIPPRELISYMDEAAKGLDFLNAPRHDLGEGLIAIQHCDVKPANIVLIGSSAVVCDFGLARILTRSQITATSTAGTPAYMAPEAIGGKPSRTSDQYALAVTYYHLRTGRLPVSDGSLWEVLEAHRQGNLRLGLVSEEERSVLRRATSLEWESRFETNIAMVESLREALRAANLMASPSTASDAFSPDSSGADSMRVSDASTARENQVEKDSLANDNLSTLPQMQADVPTGLYVTAEQDASVGRQEDAAQQSPPREQATNAGLSGMSSWGGKRVALYAGSLAVIVLAAVGFVRIVGWGAGGEDHSNRTERRGSQADETQTGQGAKSPREVLAEALTQFEVDEQESLRLFGIAVDEDPGIAVVGVTKLLGHHGDVMEAVFSPRGDQLVTSARDPRLWRLDISGAATAPDAKHISLLGHTDLVEAIAIDPAGTLLATAGYDGDPLVWALDDADVAASKVSISEFTEPVSALAWHPTEPVLIAASNDRSMVLWQFDAATDPLTKGSVIQSGRFPLEARVRRGSLSVDPTGRWVTTISDAVAGPTVAQVIRWKDAIRAIDGNAAPSPLSLTDGVHARVSAWGSDLNDDATLVVGLEEGAISRYTVSANPSLRDRIEAHEAPVESIRVARLKEGDVIVSGAADGTAYCWRPDRGGDALRWQLSDQAIASVDLSSDGRWAVAGTYSGSVILWETSDETLSHRRYFTGSVVNVVRIDPTGHWLVAGCEDGSVRVWDFRWMRMAASLSFIEPAVSDGPEADRPAKEQPSTSAEIAPLAGGHGNVSFQ